MTKNIIDQYKKYTARKRMFIFVTALLLIVVLIAGMIVGASSISLSRIFEVMIGSGDKVDHQIILNIRLPRVLSAMIAGTALAVSGTIMQSILRNPLGSPFTLGISNAAAFGAAFAVIVLGAGSTQSSVHDAVSLNNPYIITISAFFWSDASSRSTATRSDFNCLC